MIAKKLWNFMDKEQGNNHSLRTNKMNIFLLFNYLLVRLKYGDLFTGSRVDRDITEDP